MRVSGRLQHVFGLLVVVVLGMALLLASCEPGGDIKIQNLQNREVTIFFIDVRTDGTLGQPSKQGVIAANATKRFGIVFLGSEWVERIEAQGPSGSVVFSHEYTLEDMKNAGWKITIPP